MGCSRSSLLLLVTLLSGCGFGVGAFRGRERFGTFATNDQSGVREGYERVQTETWTDVGQEFGVSAGFKPALVFAAAPGGGPVGVGYGFDVHLNLRWRMIELTGGYVMERADFEGPQRVERNGLHVGLNYYLLIGDSPLIPYAGAAFQVGDVCFGAEGCESAKAEDAWGGRGTLGVALVLPEALFEQDLMLRLEGRFIGSQSVSVGGRTGPFLGGALALEVLMFF
ncbi:MAG: hypothetical protein Q8L48_21395 [Archangium sp.]|nr:hypothetical protein [Archangium sp.]